MLKKVVSPTWNGACVLMQQKSRYSDKITFTTRTMIKIRMTNQLTPVRNFGVMDSLAGMAKQKMEDSRGSLICIFF